MKTYRSNFLAIAFTATLLLCAYIMGLFVDLTGDAGKYAAIARHIVESGDWINLRIHHEPYDQKPPLLFWLAALGFKIGGFNNWSFKIFPVLYSFAGFWFTYKLGQALYNKNTGLLAALMLAASWVYFLFAMDVHTDLILQANITLAIWQLVVYEKTKKVANFIWAFVGVGLAMMTKGPIGAVIPGFALSTHLLLKRDFKELFHPKWLLGILLAITITTPAFIGLYKQFGLEGIKFFFFTNNLGRITGSYAGNNTDYLFYLHTILYLVLPWTFLVLFGFYHEFRDYLQSSYKSREYYTVGGIWVFFLIATIAKGKAPHYIFSLIPMILIITARWVAEFISDPYNKPARLLNRAQVFISIFLLAFIVFIMIYLFPVSSPVYWVLLGVSFVAFIFFQLRLQSGMLKLVLPSVLMMSVLIICLNGYALPIAFSYQASTRASQIYNTEAGNDTPFYNYLYPQYEIFFYSKSDARRLYSINEFEPGSRNESWIFTTEAGKDTISSYYSKDIAAIYPLQHKGMTNLNPKFMNPATRQQTLEPMFLIRISPSVQNYLVNPIKKNSQTQNIT